jgi:predicted NBD/HSP70 family sugar kinase
VPEPTPPSASLTNDGDGSRAYRRALDGTLTYGALRLPQQEVAERLGMDASTFSRMKNDSGGLLVSDRVRGSDVVRFGPDGGLVLSISVGVESLRAGLVDANGDVYAWWNGAAQRGQRDLSPDELAVRVRQAAIQVLSRGLKETKLVEPKEDGRRQPLRLLGAVASWSSAVNRANHLKGRSFPDGWNDIDVRQWLADVLGGPFAGPDLPGGVPRTHALNDANAAALAIAFDMVRADPPEAHRPRERRTLMVMRVSGGIGLGTVELPRESFPGQDPLISPFVRARLMVGTQGAAGEIGHLPIASSEITARYKDESKGLRKLSVKARCSCNSIDRHLEALAGSQAFTRRLVDNVEARYATETEAVEDLLRPGPDGSRPPHINQALRDAGHLIGLGLTGPILVLNPSYITFVGALADRSLLEGVQEKRSVWRGALDTGADIELDALDRETGMRVGVRGAGLAIQRGSVHRKLHRFTKKTNRQPAVGPTTFDFAPVDLDELTGR